MKFSLAFLPQKARERQDLEQRDEEKKVYSDNEKKLFYLKLLLITTGFLIAVFAVKML